MIEQHLRKNRGERPKPSVLRELLVRNVYGIDRDEDACRVAELSLILTMLDYVEPPDLSTNPDFKIPNLHKHQHLPRRLLRARVSLFVRVRGRQV